MLFVSQLYLFHGLGNVTFVFVDTAYPDAHTAKVPPRLSRHRRSKAHVKLHSVS